MGVTYKLSEEIVSFITLQKREHPDISCRSLVGMINEKFSLKVSKSTINSVLKKANLNGPIGRPSQKKIPTRKFSLPNEKKIQAGSPTTKLIQKESQLTPKSAPPAGQKSPGGPLALPKFNLAKNVETKRIAVGFAEKQDTNQESSLGLNIESSEEQFIEVRLSWFLTAFVLRDFFSSPILDAFFKRHTSFSQRDIDILDALMCFYPQIFGNFSVALEKENTIIWKILGWKEIPTIEEIESIIQYLKNTEISTFDFYIEAEYFLTMISSVHLITRDGQMLALDGRMKFIASKDEYSYFCPIERSFSEITRILSGKEMLRLHCPEELFSQELLEKIVNLCCDPNSIQKIIFIGRDNRIVSQIDQVSVNVNEYVLNMLMPLKKCEELFRIDISMIGKKLSSKAEEFLYVDEKVNIKEIFLQSSCNQKFRFAIFCNKEEEFAKVILTNISEEVMGSLTLFNEFIERPSNADFKVSAEESLLLTAESLLNQEKLSILLDNFLEIMIKLSTQCIEKYLNVGMSGIIKTSLFVKCDKNVIYINFQGPKGFLNEQLIGMLSHLFTCYYDRRIIRKFIFC